PCDTCCVTSIGQNTASFAQYQRADARGVADARQGCPRCGEVSAAIAFVCFVDNDQLELRSG
ncbi:MAG TPA: hypothetical protein PL146_16510, partial [Mycobacterium sp.]|nr:hypothetical protein [Mycobacterium sp.]